MKAMVNIMLFFFLSFLAAPTIISVLDDDNDISVSYNLNEEEMQKEMKEIKAGPSAFSFTFIKTVRKTAKILSENLRRHKSVFGDVFSPPPELV